MDHEFEAAKAEFKKVIEKCIEMKWITVNEYISLDGVASQFANKLTEMKRLERMKQIMDDIIWFKQYYYEEFEAIGALFNFLKEKPKEKK